VPVTVPPSAAGPPSAARPPASSAEELLREVTALAGPRFLAALPLISAEIIEALRREVPEYSRPLEGEFGRLVEVGVSTALAQFLEPQASVDLDIYDAIGRAEFAEGRPLDALQSAFRVGARVAWRHVTVLGAEGGVPAEILVRLAGEVFAYLDRLAAAAVAGWSREQASQAGAAQARRHALLELLARQPAADPVDVERAAEAAGWSLPPRLAALVVDADTDPVLLARRMPVGTLGAALEPLGLLLIGDPDAPGRRAVIEAALAGRPAALGPVVGWREAGRSVQRARLAWGLTAHGLLRADDHLLELFLAADPGLARDLVRLRLAPLLALPEGARRRAEETLRAWLDAHGDVSATAQMLHVHPQTVRYRLAGLREGFGTGLDDPTTRLEIALALRARLPPTL